MKNYVIVHSPAAEVFLSAALMKENKEKQTVSNLADEMLYGEMARILKRSGSWLYILSEYGYAGYIQKKDVDVYDQAQVDSWLFGPLAVICRTVDVLTIASVHGCKLITLPAGAVIKLTGVEMDEWSQVKLVDGSIGFIPSGSFEERRYDSGLLTADPDSLLAAQNIDSSIKYQQVGGCDHFYYMACLSKWFDGNENEFRKTLVNTAKSYLGTQYRWGGRSGFGIDCSGLVQSAYLRCGIAVFRDAVITDGYPLKRLELNLEKDRSALLHPDEAGLRPGDTLYSPGHIMMYIGNSEFIHSTGKAGVCKVVINSLDPLSPVYREDLAHTIYAAAGVR